MRFPDFAEPCVLPGAKRPFDKTTTLQPSAAAESDIFSCAGLSSKGTDEKPENVTSRVLVKLSTSACWRARLCFGAATSEPRPQGSAQATAKTTLKVQSQSELDRACCRRCRRDAADGCRNTDI